MRRSTHLQDWRPKCQCRGRANVRLGHIKDHVLLVVQRELGGLEGFALQIPSSVGVRGAAKPPLAPHRIGFFGGLWPPNPHSEVKSRCSVSTCRYLTIRWQTPTIPAQLKEIEQ